MLGDTNALHWVTNQVFMTKSQNTEESSAVKDAAEVSGMTLAQIEEYLKNDLAVVRTLLAAIHDDPNCLRAIATHLHGRAQNFNQAQANADKLKSN